MVIYVELCATLISLEQQVTTTLMHLQIYLFNFLKKAPSFQAREAHWY